MSKVLNERPLSEIQAIREMQKKGDIEKQLEYIASLIKSNSNSADATVLELNTALSSLMGIVEQTTIEITTMMATLTEGK